MALAKGRNTRRRDAELVYYLMAAGAVAHEGGIAVAEGGYAKPGEAGAGLVMLGRFEEGVSNAGGAAGDASVLVRRKGAFLWGNSAGDDAVTAARIGSPCWIVDDETVAATDDGGARSRAGSVVAVGDDGVWVDVESVPRGPRVLRASADLDFPVVAAGGSHDKEIAVPGAALGDAVALGLPANANSGAVFQAFVSEAGKVKVRLRNESAGNVNEAEATFRVAVIKF